MKGSTRNLWREPARARLAIRTEILRGVHRWSRGRPRQQAIDYGTPVAEVERYVVMPGQACAYKMGEIEILALRTGTVPLAVLGTVVDADIASARVRRKKS